MTAESKQTYFDVPGVATVMWDGPANMVVVEWQGWANTAEFGALLDAEIKALKEHKASRLLADCRLQRVLNLADQERANDGWIPRAIAAGLTHFAVVVPISDLAAAQLRERLAAVPASGFRIAYFSTSEDAYTWLRAQKSDLKALPAESK